VRAFDAVFFDLDGTLWDRRSCSDRVLQGLMPRILQILGEGDARRVMIHFNAAFLEMVREYGIHSRRALSKTERFERLLGRYGVRRQALAQELGDKYTAAWRLFMRNFLRGDALRVLEALREQEVALGAIVNGVPAIAIQTVEGLGLRPYLDHLVISGLVGVEKPDRRIFDHALKLAGVEPDRALHVGDNPVVDVAGAKRAGMKAAWLQTREHRLPKGLSAPDYVVGSLGEVLKLVTPDGG
jgi:putative hydrolase of the HAD superfamily